MPCDDSPAQLKDEAGAHITIFARRQGPLDEARNKILAARRDTKQEVHAVSLDLGNPSEVRSTFRLKPTTFRRGMADQREQLDAVFRSQARLPDVLYCVAGGTSGEIGFFTDIDVGKLESCMRNNYFTAAYAAQSILKIWTEDDKKAEPSGPRLRQIVFINSAAAFLGMPGYAAYTCKFGRNKKEAPSGLISLTSPFSSFEVRRARFGRYAEDGSSSTLGPGIHVHDPLCIPLQLHLSGVSRGAGIETGTDETNRRHDGIDGRAGATIPHRGESGSGNHCWCGERRFCALRRLNGVRLAFR